MTAAPDDKNAAPSIIGKRFGRLVVISSASPKGSSHMVNCRCDCGTEKTLYKSNLLNGRTVSCGCLFPYAKKQRTPLKNHRHLTKKEKIANQRRYKKGVLLPWMK